MTELQCLVENCTYNRETYCCKGDITVGGKKACCEDETCCESFVQRREGSDSYTNAIDHAGKAIAIDCKAEKCVYNDDCKCTADHVDIKGCGACSCSETACATFDKE